MKKILFIVLAGVVMAACQKPGNTAPGNGDAKQVSIAIKTAAATRAALGHNVTDDVAVTALERGTLFFFNAAGTVVTTHTLTHEEITAKKATVENVPATVETVAMIANAPADLTATAPETFAEFKTALFGIEGQASMSAATGGTTAAPDAVQDIALLDKCGYNASGNPVTGNTSAGYTASVTLVPAVSRIEIGEGAIVVKGPKVTRAGEESVTDLMSFDFEGIYINNYSCNFTLGFAQDEELFGVGIQDGGSPAWGAEDYMTLRDPAACTHLYDVPENSLYVDRSEANGVGGYAYHVFPGNVPHIIIEGSNFVFADDQVIEGVRYWLIDKYWNRNGQAGDDGYVEGKGTPISAFIPGYVYRIDQILVGDTAPTRDPYDKPVSVEVTVTIAPWQVQNTYVEPN